MIENLEQPSPGFPGPLWIKITGQAAGTNRYSWEQVDESDTAAFDTGVATGFKMSGTSATDGWPAYEINGRTDVPVDGSVRARAWMSVTGEFWIFQFGGNSVTDCTGCGWTAGLRDTSCLNLTRVEASGDCDCDDDDVDLDLFKGVDSDSTSSWSSGDVGTYPITICGIDFRPRFFPMLVNQPSMTLVYSDGSGGETGITGSLDCCGDGYAIFAFGPQLNDVLCPEGDNTTECNNKVRLKVECGCGSPTIECCVPEPQDLPLTLYLLLTDGSNTLLLTLHYVEASSSSSTAVWRSTCTAIPDWIDDGTTASTCSFMIGEFMIDCSTLETPVWRLRLYGYDSEEECSTLPGTPLTLYTDSAVACPMPSPIFVDQSFPSGGGNTCIELTVDFEAILSETPP